MIVKFGPCCFCGQEIAREGPDPCSLTVKTLGADGCFGSATLHASATALCPLRTMLTSLRAERSSVAHKPGSFDINAKRLRPFYSSILNLLTF